MKFWEAMKALDAGHPVRRLDLDNAFYPQDVEDSEYEADIHTEWELYCPPQTFCFSEVVKGLREGRNFKRKHWGYPIKTAVISARDCAVATHDIVWHPSERFWSPKVEDFEAVDWIEVR